MKKITDPAKLLPAAKSAAVSRRSRPKDSLVKQSTAIVKREPNALAKSQSAAIVKKEKKDIEYVNVRLLAIDNLFRNDFINTRREAEQRRRRTEEQDFTEAEKKIETPKSRKFKLGGKGDSPSLGFFDRVKRFLFFTALGWLVPKLIEFLPKLTGIVKTIGTVYKFAEGLFGKLFDGFMTLVKFGGDVKKQTLGFIATMKGGDYQTEFNKLEKTFDTFVNASIIAGVLAADIGFAAVDEYNKWRKKGKVKAGKPSKKPRTEEPRVTQGRGGRAGLGAVSRVTRGRGGRAPGWWNRILRGPFAKLKGPLAKFAGAAVPGIGAVVGAADAKARFAAGDKIGGALASASAGLDTITMFLATTGIGVPVAGALSAVSIGIDAILLIRDIAKTFFPFIPMFSKGGRVVNRYQNGGTATRGGRQVGSTTRTAPRPKPRKPIRTKPPETKPGRDVGGENKIKQYYAKDSAANVNQSPFFGLSFLSTPEDKNKNKPFETLKKTSKILKELPFGLGYFAGGAIDIALGQSMDVKKGLNQLSSGVAYMVDTLANQRVNMSMSALTRDLNAFAEGGFVPPNRQLRDPYAAVNSRDLIAKVLGPTIDQKVNEAIQSIEKDLRSIQQKKEEAPSAGGAGGLGGGAGGGGGPMVESVDLGGISAEDVDALGRMIEAEAGNQSNEGKAAVMNVILNRYRLAKSGKGYIPRGKNKENVTIRDILYANNQFSPIADGRFNRTSSSSGKNALVKAIAAGGNDPQKLKDSLIRKYKLTDQDANYVIVSTAFSNPESRSSRPFNTKEITVGNHTFQESPYVRLSAPGEKIAANVRETTLSNQFIRNLEKSLPGITLKAQSYRSSRSGGIREHAGRDYDLPTDGVFYSRIGGEVVHIGNDPSGYGMYIDIYNKELNRTERIAEGTTLLSGIKRGSIISPGQPVVQGTHQTGVIHYEIRRGRETAYGVGGTEDPDLFLSSKEYQKHISRIKSAVAKQKQSPTNPESTKPTKPKQEQQNWWDNLNPANWGKPQTKPQSKMQQGGLIRPRGTQLPLTNSFASYENPTASPMIAIQPIIIEKPSYTAGNRAIAFPVPVALNNDKSSFLSRG